VIGLVPAERRATLLASPDPARGVYRFDIVVQGTDETVFFNI
jgi:protocatechuate 3,4-dioxygenase alpha subunit